MKLRLGASAKIVNLVLLHDVVKQVETVEDDSVGREPHLLLRYVVSELFLDFFALDFERRTINVAVWAHNVLLLKLLETILPGLIHLNNYTDVPI